MKLDEDKLLEILRRKEESAGAYVWGGLGQERLDAMKEYYRQPYGNEEDGWSQIVTSDVQDSVEWILPDILEVFASTDKAVSFEPTKAEDVKGAEQATDACNYVFYKQNNGFLVLYTAIKDALIVRNCAVMWRKEEKQVVSSLPFKQIPAEALAMAMQEGDEIAESNSEIVIDPYGQQVELFTGRIKRTEKKQTIKVEAFPPDELLVDRDWTSPLLDDCPYVSRFVRVTCSDLKQMGFNVSPEELKASDGSERSSDASARLSKINQDSDSNLSYDDDDQDALTEGWLRIEFVLVDADGDGIAERRIIYRLQDKILSNEVCDHVQIATASPVLNTHRWDGMSLHDLVSDLQKLNTEVLRQTLNNLYLTNNPRTTLLTDASGSPMANIDDLLDSRPGGVVRTRDMNAIGTQATPFAAAASLPMLEHIQQMRENRTGVSRTSQGLNPDSLNNTATGRQIDQTASQKRTKLVARIFAEVLLKPIFRGVLKLLTDGSMEKIAFRLRNEFVEYDPNEWRDGYDMTVNVGLGTGDTAQQFQNLQFILNGQERLMPLGIANAKNIYNAAAKLIEAAGYKDVQNYLTDPDTIEKKPPEPPLVMQVEQMKLQAEGQNQQLRHQEKMAEISANLRLQEANDIRDAERTRMQAELQAQSDAIRLQYEDKWKELDANTKVLVAEINKNAELKKTAMTINSSACDPEMEEMSEEGEPVAKMSVADLVAAVNNNMAALIQMQQQSHSELVQHIGKPRQIKFIRDETGRAQGAWSV